MTHHACRWNLSPPMVWRCPYCRATAPLTTPHADWSAAHGPCQEAAEKLTLEQLIQTYVTSRQEITR